MKSNLKISVLFVDDDTDLIDSIRRMLYSMRKQWKMYFAYGGKEAIEKIKNHDIDVIVCDIRMPEMDGTEVLKFVQENYPQVIRIVLSGYSNQEMILKTTRYAHQFMTKPTNGDTIIKKINYTYNAKSYLDNPDLIKFIAGIKDIPTLPDMYMKLEEEISKEDFSIDKIAELVQTDPVLVAKVLQVVNSGFFGLPMSVTRIKEALSYLGVNILKALVMHVSTFNVEKVPPTIRREIEKIGTHSLKTANTCKNVCRTLRLSKDISDKSFLAGVLHDLGKLILIRKPDNISYMKISDHEKMVNNEQDSFGFNHAEAGAYLLSIWGLPESIVQATAYHHFPAKCNNYEESPLLAVYISNQLVNSDSAVLKGFYDIYDTGEDERIREYLSKRLNFDFNYLDKLQIEIDFYEVINNYLNV